MGESWPRGRVYRPVFTTSVKNLPYRRPAQFIRANPFLATRDKIVSSDHCVTDRTPYLHFSMQHEQRVKHVSISLQRARDWRWKASLLLWPDCYSRTRDRNVVEYLGVIHWMSIRRWCTLPNSTMVTSCRILNTTLTVLTFECNILQKVS